MYFYKQGVSRYLRLYLKYYAHENLGYFFLDHLKQLSYNEFMLIL